MVFIRAVKRELTYRPTNFFKSCLILHTYHLQNKMHLDVMETVFIRAEKPELTISLAFFKAVWTGSWEKAPKV